jgi:hypothetical protein
MRGHVMRGHVMRGRIRVRYIWYVDIRRFDESAGYTRETMALHTSVAVSECTFLSIDVWIDPFKPGHSQNNLVRTEGGDEEGFFMFDAGKGKLELHNAVGME